MLAYVVSLGRRPERLAAFEAHVDATGLSSVFSFEPFVAVDGMQLDLDDWRPRMRPWNLVHMDDRRLRGILGCALSHLELWRRIAEAGTPVAVFEDDARIAAGADAAMVARALARMPPHADLILLNDFNYEARAGLQFRVRRKLEPLLGERSLQSRRATLSRMPDVLTTAEAYVVSPGYAQRLYQGIRNDLGAIDRHMQLFNARSGGRIYQCEPPLFTQADRHDSDTIGTSTKAG